ncbi:hypothetical protein JCM3774_002225 [Rhodotorula dairenensis]
MSSYPPRDWPGGGRGPPRDDGRGHRQGGSGYASGSGSGSGGGYGGQPGGSSFGSSSGRGPYLPGPGQQQSFGRGPPPNPPPARAPSRPPNADGDDADEPVLRRDQASIGRPIRLTTNCFDVELADARMKWYKYEVHITQDERPADQGAAARRKAGAIPRNVLREVWLAAEKDANAAAVFHGVRAAYDGGAACFTDQAFPAEVMIRGIRVPMRARDTFTLVIRNPLEVPVQSIRNYVSGHGTFRIAEVAEAQQAINVIFRHGPCGALYSTRTSYFQIPAARQDSLVVSRDFLKLIRGFFAAIRPCQRGLQLVLNSTSAAFLAEGQLSDFIVGFLEAKDRGRPNLAALPPTAFIQVNRILKKLDITVHRSPDMPVLRTKMKGRGLVAQRPRDTFFAIDGDQETDVEDYMHVHFGIRLDHPDWPVVETKPGVFYPVEMISVDVKNRYLRRLDPDQQKNASAFQAMKPAEKLGYICYARRAFVQELSIPLLAQCGILIEMDPKRVDGRLLEAPMVEYRNPNSRTMDDKHTSVFPRDGGWMMKFARQAFDQLFFLGGKQIDSLAIILASPRDRRQAPVFFGDLFAKAAALGLSCSKHMLGRLQDAVYDKQSGETPQRAISNAIRHAEKMFQHRPRLLIWVFSEANSPDYAKFKFESVRLGIASQAIQSKKLAKVGEVQLAVNLAMKINAKLSGQNFRLGANSTDGTGRGAGWLSLNKPMIVGADLSHEPDRPSVAVLTATMHDQNIICAEAASVQALVEPGAAAPPSARAKKQETIQDAQKLFLTLLKTWTRMGKLPPESILILRDGISESEFRPVIKAEVGEYRRALESFRFDPQVINEIGEAIVAAPYKHEPAKKTEALKDRETVRAKGEEALAKYKPRLSFVACVKGHHVRLFDETAHGAQNIPPGTVVDSGVTDARWTEAYMASHKALIGTTRPTRYVLLVDENGFTSNEFESTIHCLSYSYQRCNKAVSLPAPVYYAHLIAGHIRKWIISDHSSASSAGGTDTDSTPASRRQDLRGAESILAETEPGREWFRTSGRPAMWWL